MEERPGADWLERSDRSVPVEAVLAVRAVTPDEPIVAKLPKLPPSVPGQPHSAPR
jgi:hypothetical protein